MSLLAVTSGDIASGIVKPEGVDFDGVTDYLSRSTDLIGNVDSKTFTFSCWVYLPDTTSLRIYSATNGTSADTFIAVSSGNLIIYALDSSGTARLYASGIPIPTNTFVHILFSCDLSNTSKRFVYINDTLVSPTYNTYLNYSINFTSSAHCICANAYDFSSKLKGRISNLFIDYVYRDLSIEANRRLFITADGKPTPTATLKALNPILYLPMKDASTAHINEGTGGNFTMNGTLDTASRGANQDNCKASKFDRSADYLRKTSFYAGVDSGLFTIRMDLVWSGVGQGDIFTLHSGTTVIAKLAINNTFGFVLTLCSSGGTILIAETHNNTAIKNRLMTIVWTWDTSDTAKQSFKINNVEEVGNMTFPSRTLNGKIGYSVVSSCTIAASESATTYHGGNIGELYFDTRYTDLATSNPFWDKDTNRPKPVRQVMQETGITPIIAMPLDASNAGKNYGTGGDFTANSAPYVGARSASEFWARSKKAGGYLEKLNLPTFSTKTCSMMLCIKQDVSQTNNNGVLSFRRTTNSAGLDIYFPTGNNQVYIQALSDAGTTILDCYANGGGLQTGNWIVVLINIDLGNAIAKYYKQSGLVSSTTYTLVNNTFSCDGGARVAYSWTAGGSTFQEDIGSVYFTTDYIDFSQEANRNKFVDQLGYPKDLKAQIDAGVIPKPLIYLPFDEPTNLGKNLGTGGDFSVVGTVTAGADFSL